MMILVGGFFFCIHEFPLIFFFLCSLSSVVVTVRCVLFLPLLFLCFSVVCCVFPVFSALFGCLIEENANTNPANEEMHATTELKRTNDGLFDNTSCHSFILHSLECFCVLHHFSAFFLFFRCLFFFSCAAAFFPPSLATHSLTTQFRRRESRVFNSFMNNREFYILPCLLSSLSLSAGLFHIHRQSTLAFLDSRACYFSFFLFLLFSLPPRPLLLPLLKYIFDRKC